MTSLSDRALFLQKGFTFEGLFSNGTEKGNNEGKSRQLLFQSVTIGINIHFLNQADHDEHF